MMNRKTCSIVISLFNEEDALPVLYRSLTEEVGKETALDWEFIFVDDGSTDRSFEILRQLHENDKRIKVIRLSRNFGAHEGTAAGINFAGGDAAILMAADMQDPPELIHEFIKKWREGYQVVWGTRQDRKDPFIKKFLASIFYWTVSKTASQSHPSKGSGSFCLITRPVINLYNRLSEHNRVTFELIAWMGFRQAEVGFSRPGRYAGKSKFTIGRQLKTAFDSLFAMTQLPVRIISYFGFITALMSMGWASLIIFQWLFYGVKVLGWASIMVSVLFLGGVILISIGMIGEYLWRILDESRRRPLYVVMEKLGEFQNGQNGQRDN
ncbi:MAG: glycosyltransferase family 2 protein [Deltaproteobacteria bacterium]|nr:glycosyltransferase family 2 protein [Deltaproteobacteria bacterium]